VTQVLNYSSICILRLSAIGDVCHGVSAVQAIQKAHPNAKITWVIGKIEAMLLADLPGVELVVFDKKQGSKAFKNLKQRFKGQQFDVLLNMQVALRAGLVAHCIPAKIKIGFDWARSKELHSLFINKRIEPEQQAHVLEGFKGFAKAIGVDDYQPHWEMPFAEQDEVIADTLLFDEQFEDMVSFADTLEAYFLFLLFFVPVFDLESSLRFESNTLSKFLSLVGVDGVEVSDKDSLLLYSSVLSFFPLSKFAFSNNRERFKLFNTSAEVVLENFLPNSIVVDLLFV
jgi:hypothetical protein